MEASNPHLRLPSIVSAYSCTSGANQSPPVYRQSYSKQHQTPGFPNNTARVRHTSVQDSKLELNSHGDHQRISTLTKMNCMTNSSPINSVSTDSSCNFSHSTNVNHTSQLDSNIQYEHGTHDASLTQYTQQQAKEQNARAAQYPSDPRQHPSIQRIEQLQQLEQQQQQLNYQQLVQQHSLSQQQQQQQLIRYQNQIAQQLVLQQQGDQFPQSLNPVQQQYLLQQRYQQQQHDQQQANLQQQLAYQQQQQQYLASQSSHESANPNQLQANQQAFLQQQLAYQHHLLSQQQATGPNAPEVKQECLDTQQQALLQQIGFQQQNIKTEVNGQQAKQEIDENRSQQHQSPQQQVTYQQPKSAEQGNHNLKQESFGQQNLHPSLQEHALYQPKLLVQQNLKPEPSSTEQQQRNSESNDSPTPNQIVQQISFKPEHATQLNKEIAVQNQLILQQQLAYQHQLLAQQQQQQNAGKSENINPVFFQNVPQTSKAESNRVITPQQNFLQHQLAYEQQLIAQHQKFKSEPSSETNFPKQTTDSLKQKTIESVPSNQQNLIHQQIEYQQQILQQQTAVKSEPNEISQKYLKEAVQQNSQQQQTSLPQQAPYPKPDSVSGKQDSLISLPLQQSLQLQQAGSLPSQIGPQHLLSGHPLPPQFAQLSLPRDVSQLLPGGQQLVGSDSRPLNKVESTHPLLPGQIVLPGGQKITNQPRSVLTSSSIGSASGDIKVESSQSGDSDGSASCVPPPLTAIRVVPSGKVLKESNPGPAVKSDQSESKASIRVPLQWKRLIANSMVIYVSPSNTALSSMDQLKAYLQTQGTCKCGLECPLQCDSVFSFDAKVASKPWSPVDIQDFSTGEFTKLCNHKRKHMTMMGFEPDNPLDGKRLDGPDFRKKRKVYGGPYSNATGPRKPRMPKDASPAPVLQTLWNDPSSQQPPAPVPPTPLNPPPTIPPPSLSDLPSTPPPGPRMFNPRMTMLPPQQSFMQQAAQLDQQRIFRYQHPSPQQQPALSHRIYQGTPPMMGTESLYANNAYPKTPNQSGEESQNQHSPAPQALSNPQLLLSQNSSASSQAMPSCQQESMEQQLHTGQDQQMQPQNQQMQQQTSQQQGMQPQNQQMHVAQIQAMQQQAQMQAVQAQLAQQMQHQHQQAVQNQQIHLQGVPTSQQQMLSNQTHSAPMQTQQTLPQQQMASSQLNQLQMKQLNQQSSQQHQMQMQQIQAQLAQMQQMQQEYDRQNQQQSSHQPADQYQTEQSNQLSSESAHYGKFSASVPNQSNNMQDPKLSLLSQQQYRQASYPIRAPYESFPPHSAPSNYPPEGAGSYESINCDNPYQNNTNQSVPGGPGVPSSSAGVPANTYLPQPVFNYQRQTQEQLAPANIQAVQPTQRPTPPWQQNSRPTTPSNPTPPSPYERVPPLHPSNIQNNMSAVTYTPVQPEASVPVSKKRTKTAIKSPNSKKLSTEATRQDSTPTYPSFMDDPSGYLAQQTALLNSTISKQCDIRVSSEMLENKNLQRLSRRYNSGEGSTSRTPDSSVRNESSETTVERIKNQHADLKGPIQGGTVSTSNRSPGGILVPVEASSPRSTSSMNSTNSPQPYSTPPSPAPKSPERSRSMPVASGHTVSCNTLTSVLAGRSNTSLTPSVTSPPPASLPAKSPLEMVQSVVSSIQLPPSSQQVKGPNVSLADIKVSTSLPSHILVSSNGQLIVASQPQSLKSSPSLNTSPASSSSSLMTNVTGAVSQVIPSLGLNQQVLGQPTVLVNTLQAPLLFQPNIMTMDNINTVQIPQLTVSSPVGSDSSGAYSPRSQGMISPESAKRKALKANKQRKVSPQKVTSMLLTPQQGTSTGTSVVMQPQQSFAQPMLQTLILPNKGNFNNQLITTSLQPLNLVQQFPTIQQFLVPAGLGGMAVMSQDGTATLLQDTVQLNVLTPVQASSMFGGQSILTSPNSMVIRSPNAGGNVRPNASAAQGQFITTNSQNQLIVNNPFASQLQGQLSPIITNLSPNNQQISFTSPTSQRQGQEYIQCGQTLIPITSQQSNSTSPGSSSQNAAVLQHNALMQQQMNLLQQANQEQTSQNFIINETGSKTPNFIINDASSKTQNFIITTSDKQPGSTNYILSPKSDTKSPGGQTHFIINTSDSKSSGQSFIITSPTDSKQLLTSGNFILTSDKSNNGNLILSTAPQQHIQQQEKVKLLQQTQQQQIQQITQQQLQQLQQTSQQLQQFQQSQQLQTQQLQQSQQLQQVQQLQQAQQIQLQNHRLNMSTQTSIQPTSSANQMIQASPITIYVSQSQSSSTTNLYTSSSANALTNAFPCVSSSNGSVQASNSSSSYSSLSSNCPTSSVYTISSTAASSVYTSSPPDTTTLSPVEAGGVPSPCHSLEVPPSPLLGDDNQPSPTSTSVHLVSSSNTDWSDGNPDSEGFATPKASSSRVPTTSNATFVKSSSKDFVESSSSPPTHRSYSRHHHSHHHRSHSHHHHQSSSKHHHSKPSREHHSEYPSHRSDSSSSRHHSHHVTNIRPDEGSDSDHSNDSSDDSNSALATTTAKLLGLSEGDLVWGQVKGYPSWPGKLISPAPTQGRVWVKWFGMSNEPLSEVEPTTLKSLSQGLEAHHRSRKKLRKSRKLNTQLENAIQEAMAELDRMSETPQQSRPLPPAVAAGGKMKQR